MRRVAVLVGLMGTTAWARPPSLAAASPAELRAALGAPGPVRLIHLWASWCRPCVAEWPHLALWLRALGDRPLEVVTLALEDDGAAPARVLAPLGRLPGRALHVAPDALGPLLQAIDPEWDGAVPTTLIVDGAGRVVLAQHGVTVPRELSPVLDRLAPKRITKPEGRP